ncbi:acc synthase [Halenospora varia]|nr:acc synthase [Halenospora varia]
MLSARGQAYAQSGLMAGYMREKNEAYNKVSNPTGEISFANAENFLMQDALVDYVNSHFKFDARQCTYNEGPIGTLRLRKAMASHLNDHFSPIMPVTSEHVTFTAGIAGLNEMVAFSLTDHGQGILLGRPIYGSFYDDLMTKSRCQLVYASLGDVDQFGVDAVKVYEEHILQAAKDGIKIRALLICNPHNPLGKCYSRDTLKALFKLCDQYGIHLISDEVYGLSVFEVEGEERVPFTSVLSIDPTGLLRTDQLHVMYGMSKDFGAAGLRLGCLISQNKEMTKATRAIGRFHWPSEVACSIATTILEDKQFIAEYTKQSRGLLSKQYAFATKTLDDAGIDYVRNGIAGFFLWVDLAPYLSSRGVDDAGWEAEKKLANGITEAGVPLASGLKYQAERPGWFRILFTVEKDSLEEALKRIIQIARSRKV